MAIGIIGLGRLGGTLARGLSRARAPGGLYGFSRGAARARQVAEQAPGLTLLGSAGEVLERCDPVFLWMNRDQATEVLQANAAVVAARQPLVVSCTPGVPLPEHTRRWAQSLPNVNLSTGRGVTLLACGPGVSDGDREALVSLLRATGAVHEASTVDMGYYTFLCSCGPGLYARMMQLLADTLAARRGYDREFCRVLVRDTMAGTVLLEEQDGIGADEVVRRVAHPGGSTEKGLAVIDRRFPALVEEMLRNMGKW
jgi:pyrroline-5-carboxylate reductase